MSDYPTNENLTVNSQYYRIKLDSNELLNLQDSKFAGNNTGPLESTTAGNSVPYTGNPRYTLSGSILCSTDLEADIINTYTKRTSGEYPIITTLSAILVNKAGTTKTKTWSSSSRVKDFEESRGKEGAVIFTITFEMWAEPTLS